MKRKPQITMRRTRSHLRTSKRKRKIQIRLRTTLVKMARRKKTVMKAITMRMERRFGARRAPTGSGTIRRIKKHTWRASHTTRTPNSC